MRDDREVAKTDQRRPSLFTSVADSFETMRSTTWFDKWAWKTLGFVVVVPVVTLVRDGSIPLGYFAVIGFVLLLPILLALLEYWLGYQIDLDSGYQLRDDHPVLVLVLVPVLVGLVAAIWWLWPPW